MSSGPASRSGVSETKHAARPFPEAAVDGRTAPLLEVKDLNVDFDSPSGAARVLQGVNISIAPGEILGLVGESGSGKSVTAMSIIRLLGGTGRITRGSIRYRGTDLVGLSAAEMQKIRGNEISMIFQNPRSSLNPVLRIGQTLREVLRVHNGLNRRASDARAIELFADVGLADAASLLKRFPHQVSGGMAQRIMITLALASKPSLLIADEPTTALDVTIQYQIIQLLSRLRAETGLAQIVITHNLGVAAELCTRLAVMYAGNIVEEGSTLDIFDDPRHPYTRGLLAVRRHGAAGGRRQTIPGQVPDLRDRPSGCQFHPRCAYARDICSEAAPPLERDGGHGVACHFHKQIS